MHGLAFRPSPAEHGFESILIRYKSSDQKQCEFWTEKMDKFMEAYRNPVDASKFEKCDYDRNVTKDKLCYQEVSQWYPCTKENHYGFDKGTPCVFLKLNKIYDWIPELYDNISSLPNNMPPDLKNYIIAEQEKNPFMMNTVWLSCEGENPADKEFIGPLEYVPQRGFPGFFYPYKNVEGYMSPLVAVYFKQPKKYSSRR